jgi:hypothetical protein
MVRFPEPVAQNELDDRLAETQHEIGVVRDRLQESLRLQASCGKTQKQIQDQQSSKMLPWFVTSVAGQSIKPRSVVVC